MLLRDGRGREERQNYVSENGRAWTKKFILRGAGRPFRCYVSMVKSSGRAHIQEGNGDPPLMWQ